MVLIFDIPLTETIQGTENNDCTLDGDGVCDTPPHTRSDCNSSMCASGNLSNSTKNFMSYAHSYCIFDRDRFTEGQKNRMRASILASPRKDLLNSKGCNGNVMRVFCSDTIVLTDCAGEISDESTEEYYTNNADCKWLIKADENAQVGLRFSAFELETGNDSLKIYDGDSNNSSLIGAYTGSSIPETVTSTGKNLFVHFISNDTIRAKGWRASYYCIKKGEINIFPNPNSGTFNIRIDTNSPDTYQLKINNLYGQIIFDQELEIIPSKLYSIFLKNNPSGIYLATISNSTQTFYGKISIVSNK